MNESAEWDEKTNAWTAEEINTDNWAEWAAEQPHTVLEGIARKMIEHGDTPATHEYSEVLDTEHKVLARAAYGVSGNKYVYLFDANRVAVFPADA